MRLIDADALIEQLREADRKCSNDIIKACIGLVQTQYTAYDVEKVAGEIEDVLWNCYIDNGQGFKTYVNRACEILKRGGI